MDKELEDAIKNFVKTGIELDRTMLSRANKLFGSIAPYKLMLMIAEEVVSGQKESSKKK